MPPAASPCRESLTGSTADPLINGRVDMENIGMTVPGLVQKLHDLNGRIVMTPTDIRIDDAQGFSGHRFLCRKWYCGP